MTDNNYYEWSERFLDSRASDDLIDDLNIDKSIDIEWSGEHEFESGISIGTGQSIDDGNGNNRFEINNTGTVIRGPDDNPIFQGTVGVTKIFSYDSGGTTTGVANFDSNKVDFSVTNQNLRLATGQAIEDGSGTKRIDFNSGNTVIRNASGNIGFYANDAAGSEIWTRSGEPLRIHDEESGLDVIKYLTSASAPGTLELTNAGLQTTGDELENDITLGNPSSGGTHGSPAVQFLGELTGTIKSVEIHSSGDGTELEATDNAGNTVTLT